MIPIHLRVTRSSVLGATPRPELLTWRATLPTVADRPPPAGAWRRCTRRHPFAATDAQVERSELGLVAGGIFDS